MPRTANILVVIISFFATSTTACSALVVNGYRPDASGHDNDCSESYFAPIIDGVVTGIFAIAAATNASAAKSTDTSTVFAPTIASFDAGAAVALLVPAAISAMSAIVGGIRVHQCVAGNEAADERVTPLRPSQLRASLTASNREFIASPGQW